MKLLLDKNFVREIDPKDKSIKDLKNVVKYNGFTNDGEQIELFDKEADKIAPIVRFLAEWKKKKLSWLLIGLAWFLLFIFFVIMIIIFYPKDTQEPWAPLQVVNTVPLQSTSPEVEIVKTETKTENETETSWALELANEADMYQDMKNNAELEVIKLNYEIDRLNIELQEKIRENEKLTILNNSLTEEIEILNTRKNQGATDEFIYYLWDTTYNKCKKPTTVEMIEKCKTLYFNYLEYAENR